MIKIIKYLRKSKFGKFLYGFEDFINTAQDWLLYVKKKKDYKIFWNQLNTIVYNKNIRDYKYLWMACHKEAEQLAAKAQINTSRLSDDVWSIFQERYYYYAAQEELEALIYLSAITKNQSKMLGIIAISAVSLLYKAGEIEETKTKAIRWMADKRIPDFACHQLQEFVKYKI